MKKQIIFGFLLVINCLLVKPCTIGVAIGKATSDGRPMLWKTRDYEIKHNILFYTKTDRYNFISNVTPEYGYEKSWFGLNDKGFAIVNTFIQNYPDGMLGFNNGEIMNEALKTCATVKNFQNLLDSTNITGRRTKAVFGVIDAFGGAFIFEVNADKYWMFDANDKNIAPDGYIIRTNYTISNGGSQGIERFNRSSSLIASFYKSDSLNVKSILQYQMRDMADSFGKSISTTSVYNNDLNLDGYFNSSKNICTPYSISATVIQGVKNDEASCLTTMWTMLGNPFSSIATPYWAVGQTPNIAASTSDLSLYGISQKLKSTLFDYSNKSYFNIERTIKLRELLFQVEDSVFVATNNLLTKWRNKTPTNDELLEAEKQFADFAYSKMSTSYNSLKNINSYPFILDSLSQ